MHYLVILTSDTHNKIHAAEATGHGGAERRQMQMHSAQYMLLIGFFFNCTWEIHLPFPNNKDKERKMRKHN